MAAFRRVAALAVKINLRSPAKSQFLGGEKARRCVAAGMFVAAGGVAALYLYNGMTSGRERRRQSINGLLQSIPAVEAKEKDRLSDFEDGDVKMSSHEHRFRMFTSVEYEGQLYMTPQNFIESVTMSEPRRVTDYSLLARLKADGPTAFV
ncbi:Calcium uptake protein 3, mitochondrial EF-hand domain-containing family member A2 [Takifugu flavidus]|uniref:Calcium uptake protein 3, mitochondrial EF-hand domain-containing family member A2 n=1 Tax=Takifugu flavidus TaxID=433684 RepID=A0A5C6MYY8_9TELE|nr:Calcium uptake protein 3, mitochondrial EF-hand domain-containing family member A2 [Takifugu flavidus]